MINPEKKCPRECKVVVNNMPEYAVGMFVVATWDEDLGSYWFWGACDTEEEALKVAQELNKVVVRG